MVLSLMSLNPNVLLPPIDWAWNCERREINRWSTGAKKKRSEKREERCWWERETEIKTPDCPKTTLKSVIHLHLFLQLFNCSNHMSSWHNAFVAFTPVCLKKRSHKSLPILQSITSQTYTSQWLYYPFHIYNVDLTASFKWILHIAPLYFSKHCMHLYIYLYLEYRTSAVKKVKDKIAHWNSSTMIKSPDVAVTVINSSTTVYK